LTLFFDHFSDALFSSNLDRGFLLAIFGRIYNSPHGYLSIKFSPKRLKIGQIYTADDGLIWLNFSFLKPPKINKLGTKI